eukprot:g2190.t1
MSAERKPERVSNRISPDSESQASSVRSEAGDHFSVISNSRVLKATRSFAQRTTGFYQAFFATPAESEVKHNRRKTTQFYKDDAEDLKRFWLEDTDSGLLQPPKLSPEKEGGEANRIVSFQTKTSSDENANKSNLRVSHAKSRLTHAPGMVIKTAEDSLQVDALIVDPDSPFKVYWDLFIGMVSIFYIIQGPFSVAYETVDNDPTMLVLIIFADVIYFLDIILTFRTATFVKKGGLFVLVGEPILIASSYIHSGRFFFDILAFGIPFKLYKVFDVSKEVISLFRIVHVLKCFRLVRLRAIVGRRLHTSFAYNAKLRVGTLVILFVYAAHVMACVFLYIGIETHDETWISSHGSDAVNRYWVGMYWAVMTISTIGYGDVVPHSLAERIYVAFSMIFGVFFYAILFGNVTTIIANMLHESTRYQQKLQQVEDFIETYRLSEDLAHRLRRTIDYTWDLNKCIDTSEILDEMPSNLQIDVMLSVHRKFILKVPFFARAEDSFIKKLVMSLRLQVALKGIYIFREHDIGEEMFFIREGLVAVCAQGGDNTVALLQGGSFFGEMALFIENGRRQNSVIAQDQSELYSLARHDLLSILSGFPYVGERFRREAEKRMAKNQKLQKNNHNFFGAKVLVRVQGAKDFRMLDNSSSDPYCIISVLSETYRTKTIFGCTKGNIAKWDEQFSFDIPPNYMKWKTATFDLTLMDEVSSSCAIQFYFQHMNTHFIFFFFFFMFVLSYNGIYLQDQFSQDDFMGKITLPLKDINKQDDIWFELRGNSKDDNEGWGKIKLSINVIMKAGHRKTELNDMKKMQRSSVGNGRRESEYLQLERMENMLKSVVEEQQKMRDEIFALKEKML